MLDGIILESLEKPLLNRQIRGRLDGSVGQIYEIGFGYRGIYLGVLYGKRREKIWSSSFQNYDVLDEPATSPRQ